MNERLLAAAEVLEKAAAYIAAVEAEKQAQASAEQAKIAADLRQKIETVTGEAPSADVLAKLASSEPTVLALIEKLAGTMQAPESLGGPVETSNEGSRSTKTASVEAAEERLLSWLND